MKKGYFNKVRFEERQIGDAEIVIARFPSPSLFVLSLLRVSEYKECAVHAGTVFAHTKYRTWFRGEHNGYDYEDYVLGMNLPDMNFKNFYETFVKANGRYKINKFEKAFIQLLQDKGFVKMNEDKLDILKKFYIIVLNEYLIDTQELDEDLDVNTDIEMATLTHELSHALYYVSKEYKEAVNHLWNKLEDEDKAKVVGFLKDKFYAEGEVMIDELGAYLIDSCENEFPVNRNKYLNAVSAIEECFQKNIGEV